MMAACATQQPRETAVSGTVPAGRPDPRAATSVAIPPPQARGPLITVAGSVDWTGRRPGCVVLELPSGQRFQLTGTAADDGERQARAGARPPRQDVEATGHIPPVGATSCGPIRAFWARHLIARQR
ncbi:hypothetical protein GCM10009634_73120 [Saccharothrix xinjiangensis]